MKVPRASVDRSVAQVGATSMQRPLEPWEAAVVDAIGDAIAFWGFKANHGRVWGLLYLRDVQLAPPEIQRVLGLSKGAVSMVVRELEQWGVVHAQRRPGGQGFRYGAETNLMSMIGRVLREREGRTVVRIRGALEAAELSARRASPESAARIGRLKQLADVAHLALTAFETTARLDLRNMKNVLG